MIILVLVELSIELKATSLEKKETNRRLLSESSANAEIYDDSVNWKDLKVKELKVESKEIGMGEKEFFSSLEECVRKCLEKVNSDFQARDKCIAKTCEIY